MKREKQHLFSSIRSTRKKYGTDPS